MDELATLTRDETAAGSFEVWLASRWPALLRFAVLTTGSRAAGEEALQSALVSACERWERVRRADDPDRYVRRMVVNAHVSGWRRTRRETPVSDPVPAPVPDPTSSPRAGVDPALGDAALWRACLALPVRQRAAVVLRFYEELEYAEIAAVLDVSEVSVRTYVHRALGTLRDRLDQEEHRD